MSISKSNENNPMFGKLHTKKTKELMCKIKLGKKLDQKTKKAITISNGTPVYLYKFTPNKLNF